jgi:cytochrome c peroxidase
VQLWVRRLADVDADRWLLQWPGVAVLRVGDDGRVESVAIVGGAPRSSGPVGPALALDAWTHVALAYHAPSGTLRTYVDGQMAAEVVFGEGATSTSNGDLLVGPAGRGEGMTGDGTAIFAIDEVAISNVFRSDEEIARAAGHPVETPTPQLANQALLALVDLPVGLDSDELLVPADNPPTEGAIELGRLLFFDPRLSRDGTVSCATCHDPARAFTDGNPTAVGIEGRVGGRNTPTIFNRAMSNGQFWDGRAPTVEVQSVQPIVSPMEMDNPEQAVLAFLASVPGYVERFEAEYGTGPTVEAMENALASFERAQLTGDTPVDRFEAGDETALSESAQRGRILFETKARCSGCHGGSNFTDEAFHATGIVVQTLSDFGRSARTGRWRDLYAFKTPTLRNIALTGPYFHDGSSETLADVVERYNRGSSFDTHDWEIRPLSLTAQEQADLVAFLEGLTDPNATSLEAPELPPAP